MQKAAITTHILQLDTGKPAAGVSVNLLDQENKLIASALTDNDGRILNWPTEFTLTASTYYLQFAVGTWYSAQERECFYPDITIAFAVKNPSEHFHVPLLLNQFGYSTYRGS